MNKEINSEKIVQGQNLYLSYQYSSLIFPPFKKYFLEHSFSGPKEYENGVFRGSKKASLTPTLSIQKKQQKVQFASETAFYQ